MLVCQMECMSVWLSFCVGQSNGVHVGMAVLLLSVKWSACGCGCTFVSVVKWSACGCGCTFVLISQVECMRPSSYLPRLLSSFGSLKVGSTNSPLAE